MTVATQTLPQVVLEHARADDGAEFLRLLFPDRDDVALSYRQLVDEASRWTAFYAQTGLSAGDRVIVALPHSLDLYAAYVGALLGGQIPAMFAFPSPKLDEDEYFRSVGTLLEGAGARLFVTYAELAGKLRARASSALGPAGVATPADAAAEPATSLVPPRVDPDHTAFLQYSSGTTGLKKGVAVSHRALLWQIDAYGDAIDAGDGDRIVSWLPLYHDMGLIACLFLPLLRKIPLVAMSPFDWVRRPGMWVSAVTEHAATLSWLPNFAYSFLASTVPADELQGADLSSLRGVVNCSEPLLAASHDAFLERFAPAGLDTSRLAGSYAMAENTFAVTSGGFGDPLLVDHIDGAAFDTEARAVPVDPGSAGARRLVSSGRPLVDTVVEIVDEEGLQVPDRVVGEIVIGSPCLMSGYDGNAEATRAVLRAGRYASGDLGYVADGHLFVTGRKQDLVIIGGRNIYPQDVETVVNTVEGVVPGRTVCFGVPRPQLGTEGLVVLAETHETDPQRAEEIRARVHDAVATHADVVPDDVQLVAHRTLVKSSSGKPARKENRRRYLEQAAETPAAAAAPAGDDLQARARALVVRIAGGRAVADDDPIVSSGLIDSFALVELISGVEATFGVALPAELTSVEALDTVDAIVQTVQALRDGFHEPAGRTEHAAEAAIPMTYPDRRAAARRALGFWSLYYRALFRLKGVACGKGLVVHGRLLLQLEHPENLVLGTNVTLMPAVHLKNRERGRIVLHDEAKLDTGVRLVAANDATIEIGENAVLGLGTVVNAGRDVRVGRGALTAAYCVVNASDHGLAAGAPVREQPYEHAPIAIGEDVWLGAGAVVTKGSRIGAGAVVSAGSIVSGELPANAIAQGVPARTIKHRR